MFTIFKALSVHNLFLNNANHKINVTVQSIKSATAVCKKFCTFFTATHSELKLQDFKEKIRPPPHQYCNYEPNSS